MLMQGNIHSIIIGQPIFKNQIHLLLFHHNYIEKYKYGFISFVIRQKRLEKKSSCFILNEVAVKQQISGILILLFY